MCLVNCNVRNDRNWPEEARVGQCINILEKPGNGTCQFALLQSKCPTEWLTSAKTYSSTMYSGCELPDGCVGTRPCMIGKHTETAGDDCGL